MTNYVQYKDFLEIYGEGVVDEATFNRLSWDAFRLMDVNTTGVDGYKKLKYSFPTDEDDAEAVKRCACKLIDLLARIDAEEKNAASSHGYVTKEDGTLVGKVVSSVSSGSESISYATSTANDSVYAQAASDLSYRASVVSQIIVNNLSGIKDANGINLLYMGVYPRV